MGHDIVVGELVDVSLIFGKFGKAGDVTASSNCRWPSCCGRGQRWLLILVCLCLCLWLLILVVPL